MNLITIIIGLIFSGYGILVFGLRLCGHDGKFKKLGPMRKIYGAKLGSLIHYIGYGLVPLIFGVWIIIAGSRGVYVFDLFK